MDRLGKREKSKEKSKNTKIKKIRLIGILLVFIFIILIIFSSIKIAKVSSKDKLAGLWDIDGITKYEFDGKGNGKLVLPSTEYKFVYEIKDDEISIDFEDEMANDAVYSFSVEKDKAEFKGKSVGTINFEMKRESK